MMTENQEKFLDDAKTMISRGGWAPVAVLSVDPGEQLHAAINSAIDKATFERLILDLAARIKSSR